MNTVIGVIADENTMASDPAQRRRAWSSPATAYRSVQPREIPVDVEHDGRWCGHVVHLERHAGNLWCVAEVDAAPLVPVRVGTETVHVEAELYFSVERTPFPDDIVLRSVALTAWPARVGAQPVEWYAGALDHRGSWLRNGRRFDGHLRDLVTRANDARHDHGRPGVVIHDPLPMAERGPRGVEFVNGEPVGTMRYRPHSGTILSVR